MVRYHLSQMQVFLFVFEKFSKKTLAKQTEIYITIGVSLKVFDVNCCHSAAVLQSLPFRGFQMLNMTILVQFSHLN